MVKYLLIALGGAIGAIARFLLGNIISSYFVSKYPWGTFFINIIGSFIIGFFLLLITEKLQISDYWRLAIVVGFTGAFTTFSTFEYEVLKLVEDGKTFLAITYVASSVIVGFLAVLLGAILARQLNVK